MRYKVKTPSIGKLHEIESLLRNVTRVYLVSTRRLMLSTDEIPVQTRRHIEELGGTVTPDQRYEVEATK